MCGLAGAMSSTLSDREADIFRDLLNVASLRGAQGSGVAVNQIEYGSKKVAVLRTKQIAGALAYSEQFADLVRPRVNCIIGHARFPTKGGLDEKAIHPHSYKHITGVHNGTLWKVDGKDVKDGMSDSAMLFEAIANKGIAEAIKDTRGAYALVWIDEKAGTINFLRNSQRTLFFKNVGWQKNISTTYWASEQSMLDFVFGRSYQGNNTWNTYLPVDTWFQYPLEVKNRILPSEVVPDIRPTPIAYNTPTTVRHMGGGRGGNRHSPFASDDEGEFFWDYEKNIYRARRPDDPFTEGVQRTLRLPPPENATKQALKKYAKERKKEEAEALKRLEEFRRANVEFDRLKAKDEEEAKIKPALTDTVVEDDFPNTRIYDTSGTGTNITPYNHTPASTMRDRMEEARERARRRRELNDDIDGVGLPHVRVVGQRCCWCDEIAKVGDKIFLADGISNRRDFICFDCGSDPQAAEAFADNCPIAIVIN